MFLRELDDAPLHGARRFAAASVRGGTLGGFRLLSVVSVGAPVFSISGHTPQCTVRVKTQATADGVTCPGSLGSLRAELGPDTGSPNRTRPVASVPHPGPQAGTVLCHFPSFANAFRLQVSGAFPDRATHGASCPAPGCRRHDALPTCRGILLASIDATVLEDRTLTDLCDRIISGREPVEPAG